LFFLAFFRFLDVTNMAFLGGLDQKAGFHTAWIQQNSHLTPKNSLFLIQNSHLA